MLPMVRSIRPEKLELYLPYFFTNYLPMNIFTSKHIPIDADILEMSKTSPALRDAIDAVAVLHLRTQGASYLGESQVNSEPTAALKFYARSVQAVQNKISSNTFVRDPSALWTTFVLGLFELMRDSTGSNWLSHFLHGTSTILRLGKPESLVCPGPQNSQRRSFFLSTRVFEISRSLIFSSPTFLSKPEWTTALARLWEGEGATLWHPKEALFDVIPTISDLSIRVLRFCEDSSHLPPDTLHALATSLASEGLVLQTSLQEWSVNASLWEQTQQNNGFCPSVSAEKDTELLVGHIYYHAVRIFLSGTYDYHVHWTYPGAPCAPILTRVEIDCHVSQIIRISYELLAHGVAGLLLFFPLRVAGARANDERSRANILGLLRTTTSRGYIVAEAFTDDLQHLWASKVIHY